MIQTRIIQKYILRIIKEVRLGMKSSFFYVKLKMVLKKEKTENSEKNVNFAFCKLGDGDSLRTGNR